MFFTVGRSYYPLWVSINVAASISSLVIWMKYGNYFMLLLNILSLLGVLLLWGYTLILESMAGMQSEVVKNGLKMSFMLFILSEVMFFFGIFWAFFDSALSPPVDLGMEWSPEGVMPINPMGIPLVNTILLLSSSITLTWSHNELIVKKDGKPGLYLTLLLAVCFLICQYVEFKESTFSMSDGVFGSVFFFGTGTHGMHVLLGTAFLFYNLIRMHLSHFSSKSHMSYEMSILYWHFVDVVWLFLYTMVYYWVY